MEKRVIPVLEMSCAVCAATVEKTVRELTGVEEASVNFSAERAVDCRKFCFLFRA